MESLASGLGLTQTWWLWLCEGEPADGNLCFSLPLPPFKLINLQNNKPNENQNTKVEGLLTQLFQLVGQLLSCTFYRIITFGCHQLRLAGAGAPVLSLTVLT